MRRFAGDPPGTERWNAAGLDGPAVPAGPEVGGALDPAPAARLSKAHRVHVIGLGGSGVRGIVPLLLERGIRVTGSDLTYSEVLDRLRSRGVDCRVGHSAANIGRGTDLVVVSAAVKDDNPELRAAASRQIEIVKYSQCLGYLMGEKRGIAVAGTHGKTTTTAMLAHTLVEAGLDPTYVIGGEHPTLGASRSGRGPHFIAEACEYDRSFLNLKPLAAAVTNVEPEHLDYFRSFGEILETFAQFVRLVPAEGRIVLNAEDESTPYLARTARCGVETFGFEGSGANWVALNVAATGDGSRFLLRSPRGSEVAIELRVPGLHNVRNAAACAALASWAGVELETIARALSVYRGVRRRFEILAREPHVVIDDYAHHPTEVRAVLETARRAYPARKLLAVFQPHQHSRLRRFLEEFADALAIADATLLTPIYRARDSEDEVRAIDEGALSQALEKRGRAVLRAGGFEDALQLLRHANGAPSVVVFMGAGDITRLAWDFSREIAALPQVSPAGTAPAAGVAGAQLM